MKYRLLKTGDTRLHHFIPRWFLEQFVEDGKIVRVRLDEPSIRNYTNVGNVAVERDMYIVDVPGVGLSTHVEDELAVIDGAAAAPVKKLAVSGASSLSEAERKAVLLWIGSLWVRGPRWRRRQEAISDYTMKKRITDAYSDEEAHRILKEKLSDDLTLKQVKDLRAEIVAGGVEFVPMSSDIVLRMLERTYQYGNDLLEHRWETVKLTQPRLVLADNPLLLHSDRLTDGTQLPVDAGLVQLPIAPDVLLNLYRPGVRNESPRQYMGEELSRLTQELVRCASEEIYFAPRTEIFLDRILLRPGVHPLLIAEPGPLSQIKGDGINNFPKRRRHRRSKFR